MRVVTYVMSQPDHLPYLIVSLRSLRRWWEGMVYVCAWPESFGFIKKIERYPDLGITPICWDPEYKGKNAQFECKQQAVKSFYRNDSVLYLDADTLITGDITPLFLGAERFGFLATQFGEWSTQGKIIQGRIKRLRAFPEIDQGAVETVLGTRYPSVNGGVFCCCPSSPVLRQWAEWTPVARSIFISDETVLHTLLAVFAGTGKIGIHLGGAFNCPPKYQPKTLADEDVKVWHFHGDCNTRPTKSLRAVKMWWPEYQECLRDNVGGIADWRGFIKHKHLDRLEPELNAAGDDWRERATELAKEK